jgi:hypothetical protein
MLTSELQALKARAAALRRNTQRLSREVACTLNTSRDALRRAREIQAAMTAMRLLNRLTGRWPPLPLPAVF